MAVALALLLFIPVTLGIPSQGRTTGSGSRLPYVQYTLSISNGTRYKGNFATNLTGAAGQGEAGIAYDNSSGYLYVTNLLNRISVINAKKTSLVKSINVGGEPFDIVYDSGNGNLYSSNLNQKLSIINGKSGKLSGIIDTGTYSGRMALNGRSNTLYLQNLLNLSYEKVGLSSHASISNVSISKTTPISKHPIPGISYDSANNTVFAANFQNDTVVVLNATSGRILRNLSFPGQVGAVYFDRAENMVYLTVPVVQQMYALNASTYARDGNVSTGGYPSSIAADNAAGFLFVTNELAATLSVYSISSLSPLETLNLSSGSTGALYVPQNGRLYVINSGTALLSIISTRQGGGSIPWYVYYVVLPATAAAILSFFLIQRRRREK